MQNLEDRKDEEKNNDSFDKNFSKSTKKLYNIICQLWARLRSYILLYVNSGHD